MIYIKNRLLISAIAKAISGIIVAVVKLVYGILRAFNLQWAFLIAIIGGILYLTGSMQANESLKIILYVLFGLSVVSAFLLSGKKITKKDKKEKKVKENKDKSNAKAEDSETETVKSEQSLSQGQTVQQGYTAPTMETPIILPEQPRYYAVKQNPNYVMAEFSDRYELYKKTPQGLARVRTDYKERRF